MYICFSVHWITILHSFYHQSIFLQLHVFLVVQMTKHKEEAAAHHWGQVTPAGWRRRFIVYLLYAHPVLWFVSWNPKTPCPCGSWTIVFCLWKIISLAESTWGSFFEILGNALVVSFGEKLFHTEVYWYMCGLLLLLRLGWVGSSEEMCTHAGSMS